MKLAAQVLAESKSLSELNDEALHDEMGRVIDDFNKEKDFEKSMKLASKISDYIEELKKRKEKRK